MRLVARHVRTVYIHSHEHKPVKSLEQHLDKPPTYRFASQGPKRTTACIAVDHVVTAATRMTYPR